MKKLLLILLLTPFFADAQVVNTILRKNTATKTIYSYSSGSAGNDTLANVYKLSTFTEGQVPAWDATNKRFIASTTSLSGIKTFVFSRDASDISGYEQAVSLNSYVEGLRDTTTITATTSGVLMQEFATNVGFPNMTVIQPGEFRVYYETKKSAGGQNYWTYAVVLKRSLAGTETVIDTTEISTVTSDNTLQNVSVSFLVTSNISMLTTDRLVVKIYARMQSSTASISLYYDNATYARMTIPSSSVDATNFVPYAGATKDLDMGVFDVTADSLKGNGLGITDVVHTTGNESVSGVKTFNNNLGIGKTPSVPLDVLGEVSSTVNATGGGTNPTIAKFSAYQQSSGNSDYPAATFFVGSSSDDENVYLTINPLYATGTNQIPASVSLSTNYNPLQASAKGLYLTQTNTLARLTTSLAGNASTSATPFSIAAGSTNENVRFFTNGNSSFGSTTDGGFKLGVTGTGRVTGKLTLGSTLSNGTYDYTLPSATGTLALTSALSNYVPYVGATKDLDMGVFDVTADTGRFASILINGATQDTTKLSVIGNAEFKNTSSSYISYWRTNQTGTNGLIKSRIGQIGNAGELNTTYNMNIVDNVHLFDDSTKYAVWTGMTYLGLAVQVAAPYSGAGDIWTATGSKYAFNLDPSGKTSLNSSLSAPLGDGLLWLNRYSDMPSISGGGLANGLGADSLLLDGGRTRTTVAPIILNRYNTGNVLIPNNSSIGVGTMTPYVNSGFNTVTANGVNGGIFATQVNGSGATRLGADVTGGSILEPRNLPINIATNGLQTVAFNANNTTTFSGNAFVPDDAYDSGWNADLSVPTKNAIWDSLLPITGGTPSFAGTITSTKSGTVISNSTAGTTGKIILEAITGGQQLYVTQEGSIGGAYVSGSPANSTSISTGNSTDLVLGTNLVKRATVTASGLDVVGNITAANLSSGGSTPIFTNTTNVSGATAGSDSETYTRIGNRVTVYGYFDVTTGAGITSSRVDLTPPISSNFTSVTDAKGLSTSISNTIASSGRIVADATNDTISIYFNTLTASTLIGIEYTYSYQIK